MENIETKKKKLLGGPALFVVVFLLVLTNSCVSSSNEDSKELTMKKAACETKSNTYYKCSYSLWEGRCVCKAR